MKYKIYLEYGKFVPYVESQGIYCSVYLRIEPGFKTIEEAEERCQIHYEAQLEEPRELVKAFTLGLKK